MRDRNRNNDNENKEFRVRVLYLFPLVVIKQFVHFPSSIVKKRQKKKKIVGCLGFFSSIDWDRHGLCELESGDNRFIDTHRKWTKKKSQWL